MAQSTALFLFAHQDDEFGVFYEIHRLVSRDDKVIVVYLTSGTSDGSPSFIRNAESTSVLKKLGVQENNIVFLGTNAGIPDGDLCSHLEVAYRGIAGLIAKDKIPEMLYFHAWEGGHQDHDAAHLIGVVLGEHLGILERCYQFPLYTGAGLPAAFFRLFFCLPENGMPNLTTIPWRQRIEFVKFCFHYPSQFKTWIGLFPFFLFHYLFLGTQVLQTVSVKRIQRPPHLGKLLYERRGFYSYKKFSEVTGNFISRLSEARNDEKIM
ncbi:MAG: PIG-L family deacetylase [Methylococcales bacterium]|nr:PIG-L family deacetylase [Methylococcales bacterium]